MASTVQEADLSHDRLIGSLPGQVATGVEISRVLGKGAGCDLQSDGVASGKAAADVPEIDVELHRPAWLKQRLWPHAPAVTTAHHAVDHPLRPSVWEEVKELGHDVEIHGVGADVHDDPHRPQ